MTDQRQTINTEPLFFISDEKLTELVKILLDKAQKAADAGERDMYKNVVDPFSASFDAARQGVTLDDWLEQEKSRQIQKSLQNFVGQFHQSVLGTMEGWEDLGVGTGVDVRSYDKKIIAEIKNKHNTMNSGKQIEVYDQLRGHLDFNEAYKGFTAYVVQIIPPNPRPYNKTYHPSDKGTQRPMRENIRVIDGKSFYELVTGDADSLQKLYNRIPLIISKITGFSSEDFVASGCFADLFKRAYLGR